MDGEVEKTNLDSAKLVFVHEKVVARFEGKFCFQNPDASNEKTLNHAYSLSFSVAPQEVLVHLGGLKNWREIMQKPGAKTKNTTKTHIHLEASRIQHVWQDFQFEFYSQEFKKR